MTTCVTAADTLKSHCVELRQVGWLDITEVTFRNG